VELAQIALFWLAAGAGVAVAAWAQGAGRSDRVFTAGTALLFWPLHVPLLLGRPRDEVGAGSQREAPPSDDMAAAIAQVERELAAAVTSLDGWAEDVLAGERLQIPELRAAWIAQSERIREIDRLLAAEPGGSAELAVAAGDPRWQKSEDARRQNLERLREVRHSAHEDLMGSLAWVRELVSMIHLARFTGAPASRAGELVAQIAAAVEGLREVSAWRS